nr:hypothetical protein [Tanacetum cinerariifolium]
MSRISFDDDPTPRMIALDGDDDVLDVLSFDSRLWVWWFNTAYPSIGYGVLKVYGGYDVSIFIDTTYPFSWIRRIHVYNFWEKAKFPSKKVKEIGSKTTKDDIKNDINERVIDMRIMESNEELRRIALDGDDDILNVLSLDSREKAKFPSGKVKEIGSKTTKDDMDHGSFIDKINCDLNKAPDSPHLHTFSPNQFHCFHCKYVLGDGEACQRCTCTRCGSGLNKGLCLICGSNQNSLNDSLSIFENSSQNPPHIDERCYECGDALDGIFCQQCTCKSCGKGAHVGYNCPSKVPIISNPEPCNQTMNNEPPQTLPSFDPTCYSEKENSLPWVSKPNLVDESPNVFNPPPQPPIYSCEFYGSNAQYGHYCTSQVPFIHPEPGYSQDFNFSQDFHDFQQQSLCCDQCGAPHETF